MITKQSLKSFFSHFLCVFSIATLFAVRWARTQYPMQKAYNVFFVVKSDTKGHDSGTFMSFFWNIIVPTVVVYVAVCLVLYAVNVLVRKRTGAVPDVFYNDRARFFRTSVVFVAATTVFSICMLKAWNYPAILYKVNKRPVRSEFYEKNYADPKDVKISFPQKKRNLVVIFMESMESSYASIDKGGVFQDNLIPGLTELAETNVNFSGTDAIGGGENLEGTSWTAAGLISKMSGLPYYMPFSKDARGNKTCLANAVTLTDILAGSGYRNVFAIGSDKQFENRDTFLEGHDVEVHDINWYKANGYIPGDYRIFWGFEDEKLFAIARQELTDLGSSGTPFFYGMLTVDTHFPDGYKCPLCKDIYKRQIMNVIRCADSQVCALVAWMQAQPWYADTAVVIMGDHNYLNAPDNNFIAEESPLPDADMQRRWLDVIINGSVVPPEKAEKNRDFSPYDMFPTMLESIGCTVPGHALGFGRSLYSVDKTLVEQFGADTVNTELMKRTVEYDALK